eukprot:3932613-Prymnesium_polylepis.1
MASATAQPLVASEAGSAASSSALAFMIMPDHFEMQAPSESGSGSPTKMRMTWEQEAEQHRQQQQQQEKPSEKKIAQWKAMAIGSKKAGRQQEALSFMRMIK